MRSEHPIREAECIASVDDALAAYPPVLERITVLHPDLISAAFAHDSDLPVAAVCLRDAQSTFGQVTFALHEFCSRPSSHRTEGTEAGRMMAVWIERFYVEYAAMRLYNAAEHLAAGIGMIRGLTPSQIASQAGRSQWERVRRALKVLDPDDSLLAAMNKLRSSRSWRFAIRYRGKVVHDQPPLVQGLGIVHERRRRWSTTADGTRLLRMGVTGDAPQHVPEEILPILVTAAAGFVDLLTAVVDEYYGILAERGIKPRPKGLSYTI